MLILQGELNQQRGLVPSNFLEAVPLDGDMAEEFHSKDKEASLLSAESQVRRGTAIQAGMCLEPGHCMACNTPGIIELTACSPFIPRECWEHFPKTYL